MITFPTFSTASWWWVFALVFVAAACTSQPISYQRYDLNGSNNVSEAAPRVYGPSTYDNEAYFPDTLHPEYTPRRAVMVNFHIMNTRDTFFDLYQGAEGVQYMKNLLTSANQLLKNNQKATLMPIGMDVPVYPINYKLYLAYKPGTDEPGVYYHYDDELYWLVHKGPKRNLGDRRVFKKYGVNLESELNLFIMPPPIDSLTSKTFKPNDTRGVYAGIGIKIGGFYPEKLDQWKHSSITNHEIGHALGLNHAWRKNDGCEDTRVHTNKCWSRSQSERCDTMTSNNLMDYSAIRNSLTPCQIGRVHARFSDLNSRSRKWLRRDWCEPARNEEEIIIRDSISWTGARDLNAHIRITPGGKLYLNHRLHLARGRKIIVEPGGSLELGPNAWVHNDCGEDWAGIETGNRGQLSGEVIIDPAARIENTEL